MEKFILDAFNKYPNKKIKIKIKDTYLYKFFIQVTSLKRH